MDNDRVEFVELREEVTFPIIPDHYKFVPKGRFKWAQRLAWRFLHKQHALDQAYGREVSVTRHTINRANVLDRIMKQRRELMRSHNKDAQVLLIGAEDFADLMGDKDIMRGSYAFDLYVPSSSGHRTLLGLTIKIIPWMRGMVVMP